MREDDEVKSLAREQISKHGVRICGAEDAEHGRRSKDGGPGEEKKLKRTGGRTSRFLFYCPRIIFGTLRSM